MTRADVLVVGSGHNALVSACYLAAAGLSVHVVEKDTVPGGAVSTVARFPGHRVDRGSSAHLMIRHTAIAEDLDLEAHGLRYLDCDPWAFAPPPPGSDRPPLVFHHSVEDTCASIEAAAGPRDADAYRRFVREWTPRAKAVMTAFASRPTGAALGRAFTGREALTGTAHMSRQYLMAGDVLLDEYFDDEPLKAALAWFGAQSGPPMSEPATASMIGFATLMHQIPPGRAIGGSGALTDALLSRFTADGGQLTLGDAVVRLTRRGATWTAVTASGAAVTAPTVIAGCHVLTTLDLLERGGFPPAALTRWRRQIRVGPGIGMALRLATSALPDYGAGSALAHRGLQLLTSDRADLRAAHSSLHAGELPMRPAVLAMSFSALDPSVAPPGEHQVTLWSQWHPYALRGGWERGRLRAATDIITEMERWAPGFSATIGDQFVQSPLDIERELGLVGGNVMHLEMSLDQMLRWRPTADLASGRVPGAPGLYLTGASTHPGGGVNGASGRSAARQVLRDRRNPARTLLRRARRTGGGSLT